MSWLKTFAPVVAAKGASTKNWTKHKCTKICIYIWNVCNVFLPFHKYEVLWAHFSHMILIKYTKDSCCKMHCMDELSLEQSEVSFLSTMFKDFPSGELELHPAVTANSPPLFCTSSLQFQKLWSKILIHFHQQHTSLLMHKNNRKNIKVHIRKKEPKWLLIPIDEA